MWWFLWLLCYLLIGTFMIGAMVYHRVMKSGDDDFVNPSVGEISAITMMVVAWPIMLCVILVLAAGKSAHERREKAQDKEAI